MSVKIRPFKNGGWEYDIRFEWPDGSEYRERKKAKQSSKSAAKRWAEGRERYVLTRGPEPTRKEVVPTLSEFKERFIEGHCVANRHKPAGISSKRKIFRVHLEPAFGARPLDRITNEDVARLKAGLHDRKPATVNNVLSTLSVALRTAVEWGVIDAMPTIKQVKEQKPVMQFYDFEQYAAIVEAARRLDPRIYGMVLLGGDAGLRKGEMAALEFTDWNRQRGTLSVSKTEWNGQIVPTKGLEAREVEMTERLQAALAAVKHLRGPRVLYGDEGNPVTSRVQQRWMATVQRRVGVKDTGGIHILRHTFCSHLAMRGVPVRTIQKLAGHKSLMTTMRYMHLAEGEGRRAIKMLEAGHDGEVRGDIVETTAETAVTS